MPKRVHIIEANDIPDPAPAEEKQLLVYRVTMRGIIRDRNGNDQVEQVTVTLPWISFLKDTVPDPEPLHAPAKTPRKRLNPITAFELDCIEKLKPLRAKFESRKFTSVHIATELGIPQTQAERLLAGKGFSRFYIEKLQKERKL